MKNSELLGIIKSQQETIAMLVKMLKGGDVYTLPPYTMPHYNQETYSGELTALPADVTISKSEEI